MQDVTFTWHETDPDRPACAVLVRLVALTDYAHDDGDLSPYLMTARGDGSWTLTISVPPTLRSSYQICPIRDEPLHAHLSEERWMEILGLGTSDPLNSAILAAGTTYGNPGPASIFELPGALPQPWHARRFGVPQGTTTRHEIRAEGQDPAIVHTYVPPRYGPDAKPLPLVILFDAKMWMSIDVAATFDNLIADGATRPMIVVAVESIHGATRWQGLTHPEIFEPFVLDELLPWMHARWSVSRDPGETVLAGQSLGGLVTSHLARSHPDRFGWVVGHSMALWWRGDNEGGLSGKQVIDSYASGERVPVRFFLDVGSRERELLESVRLMRDTLSRLDYDVRYREYEGGHDFACWRGGLADGLVAALGHSSADRPTTLSHSL
jgi:enterochelin esterase-like enzyme